jgi:hypothetical protein
MPKPAKTQPKGLTAVGGKPRRGVKVNTKPITQLKPEVPNNYPILIKSDDTDKVKHRNMVALAVMSIFTNRKLYIRDQHDDHKSPYDLSDIKSWDEYPLLNAYVDEDGVEHSIISQVATIMGLPNELHEHYMRTIERLISTVKIPIEFIEKIAPFITAVGYVTPNEEAGYANNEGGVNFPILGRLLKIQYIDNTQRLTTDHDGFTLMTTVATDWGNRIIGETYDRVNTCDIDNYTAYAERIIPTTPVQLYHINDTNVWFSRFPSTSTDISPAILDGQGIKKLPLVKYMSWDKVRPWPVTPYMESVNAVLKSNIPFDDNVRQMNSITGAPTRRTDICFQCKVELYDELYVIIGTNGYHVCVCKLCTHFTQFVEFVNTNNITRIARTTSPVTVADMVDRLDCPEKYKQFIEQIEMGVHPENCIIDGIYIVNRLMYDIIGGLNKCKPANRVIVYSEIHIY